MSLLISLGVIVVTASSPEDATPVTAAAAEVATTLGMDRATVGTSVEAWLRDDYAAPTPDELARALADEGAGRDREAFAVLARLTSPSFDAELALTRVRDKLARGRGEPSLVLHVEPVGFRPDERPVLYVDGQVARGLDGKVVSNFDATLRPGTHHVHFRCAERRCSPTRTVQLASDLAVGVPAASATVNVAAAPLAIRYASTFEQNGNVVRQARALIAGVRATAAVLVLGEGPDLRLVLVTHEGVAGSLRVPPADAGAGARRLLRGESSSALVGPTSGKVRVRIEASGGLPPVASVRSAFDRAEVHACTTGPCDLHVPRGPLTVRLADVYVDDTPTRELQISRDSLLTIHPARGVLASKVGKGIFAGGLGLFSGIGLYALLASGLCKADLRPGAGECTGSASLGKLGTGLLIGSGAMISTGLVLALRFRPFHVDVRPLIGATP